MQQDRTLNPSYVFGNQGVPPSFNSPSIPNPLERPQFQLPTRQDFRGGNELSQYQVFDSSQQNSFAWLPAVASLVSLFVGKGVDMYESQKAYERGIEQRDYQNDYNSPSQQMQRLAAAGLNPNFIYGSGSSSASGQQQGTPSYPPSRSSFDMLSTLSQFQQLDLQRAQIDNVRAVTENQRTDNALKAIDLAFEQWRNDPNGEIGIERAHGLTDWFSSDRGLAGVTLQAILASTLRNLESTEMENQVYYQTGMQQATANVANTRQTTQNLMQSLRNMTTEQRLTVARTLQQELQTLLDATYSPRERQQGIDLARWDRILRAFQIIPRP